MDVSFTTYTSALMDWGPAVAMAGFSLASRQAVSAAAPSRSPLKMNKKGMRWEIIFLGKTVHVNKEKSKG
jgi:hypothetical protein